MSWILSHFEDEIPDDDVLDELRAIDPPRTARTVDRLVEIAGVLGVQRAPYADREDFTERTMRIDAAIAAVGVSHLWIDRHDGTMSHLGDDAAVPVEPLLPRLGALPSGSVCRATLSDGLFSSGRGLAVMSIDAAASGYFDSLTFRDRNGRGAVVVDGGKAELADAICRALPASSDRTVWIKARPSKSYLLRVAVPDGWEQDCDVDVLRDVDDPWSNVSDLLVTFEDVPGSLLVAPHVPMRAEYRTFLVQGRPITGAGCIESHTPLDCPAGTRFSPLVEGQRGDGNVMPRPDLVDRYVRRAAELGVLLHAEGRGTCVLDLALVGDEIVVVELNGISNSGFYASDPYRLYRELAQHPEVLTPATFDLTASEDPLPLEQV